MSERIVERYRSLWPALTESERFETGDRWRVEERIRRLNELGFDVDELAIVTDIDGTTIQIQPKVVDAGHHSRRLLRLTGLDVEENQARRLLNDLDAYRAATDRQSEDEELVAHDWLAERLRARRSAPSRATCAASSSRPRSSTRCSSTAGTCPSGPGTDVPIRLAVRDYVDQVLPAKPDEKAVLGVDTVEMPVVAMFDD